MKGALGKMKRAIYRFKASLHELSTRIWRRFDIDRDVTLASAAYVLMTMFEMRASHLFRFEAAKGKMLMATLRKDHPDFDTDAFDREYPGIKNLRISYELVDFGLGPSLRRVRTENVMTTPLKHAVSAVDETLMFEYDFGDGWRIDLKLEAILETETADEHIPPTVLAGKGYGILEDAGGTRGLLEAAAAFSIGHGKTYDEYRRWLGVDRFDLDAFDMTEMNLRLAVIPSIYRRAYEERTEPTEAEIDLIERRRSSTSA